MFVTATAIVACKADKPPQPSTAAPTHDTRQPSSAPPPATVAAEASPKSEKPVDHRTDEGGTEISRVTYKTNRFIVCRDLPSKDRQHDRPTEQCVALDPSNGAQSPTTLASEGEEPWETGNDRSDHRATAVWAQRPLPGHAKSDDEQVVSDAPDHKQFARVESKLNGREWQRVVTLWNVGAPNPVLRKTFRAAEDSETDAFVSWHGSAFVIRGDQTTLIFDRRSGALRGSFASSWLVPLRAADLGEDQLAVLYESPDQPPTKEVRIRPNGPVNPFLTPSPVLEVGRLDLKTAKTTKIYELGRIDANAVWLATTDDHRQLFVLKEDPSSAIAIQRIDLDTKRPSGTWTLPVPK